MDIPKPLVVVKGKPIISHQIEYLFSVGIDRIILSLGHEAQRIMAFIQHKYPSSEIAFSVEDQPLGTAGAVKKALHLAESDQVLVLNCDDITDINPAALESYAEHIICLAHPKLPFGRVLLQGDYVLKFDEKPVLDDWTSCGWYLFQRAQMLDALPDVGSLEVDVFPKLRLRGYKHEGFWKPLNTPKDVLEFEAMGSPVLATTQHS